MAGSKYVRLAARPALVLVTLVAIAGGIVATRPDNTVVFFVNDSGAVPIDSPPDTPPDVAPADSPSDAPPPQQFIVIAGQSNAAGRGVSAVIDPEIAAEFPSVTLTENTNFAERTGVSLQPRADGKFGIELTLGRALPQYDLVKYAVDNTSLHVHWQPTGGIYRQPMFDLVDATIGETGEVVAFVWIQGESDANSLARSNAYETNLAALAAQVFAAWPGALFVYNRLHADIDPTGFPYASTVRTAQTTLDANPGMVMVDVDAIPLDTDDLHFPSQGFLDLGDAFATAIGAAL